MNPNPSVKKEHASVFELNGVPSFGQALPLAMQHVVAMIVGCVTPSIIVAGVAGISATDARKGASTLEGSERQDGEQVTEREGRRTK